MIRKMSTCCCTSSKSRHTLWFSLVIATLAVCGMLLYVSYHYVGRGKESCFNCEYNENIHTEKLIQANCPSLCSSKECVFAANLLLENMDYGVDPCDDFYSFSCGNWIRKFSKHDNHSVVNGMEMTLKAVLKDLLDNLNGPMGGKSEKLKMVYDSCMNDDSSEFKAVGTIQKFLFRVGIDGWPDLAPSFEFADSSLERTLGRLAAYNEFAIVRFYPRDEEGERESPTQRFNLSVYSDYPLMIDESQSDLYERIIPKIMIYFGTNPLKANTTWEEFRKIDAAVLKLYVDTSSAENEVPDYEETIQYLNCTSESSYNLVQICKVLKYFVDYTEIGQLFYEDRAYFPKSQFLENLLPLMKNFTQREVANYLSLRLILGHLDILDIRFRSILLSHPEANSLHSDFRVSAILWEQCVGWLSYHMPYALGQDFVSRKLSSDQLKEMYSIVKIYLQEAGIYISNQKWIGENDRNQLRYSIGNMTNKMEYFMKALLNGSTFNLLFENYDPTNQSFLQNVLEYRRNTLKFYLLNFRALQTEEFPSYFFTVNAYHSSGSIDIRIGMFLPPVYQYGLPKLLNLATMGTTIGHEIGHEIVVFFEDSEDFSEDIRNKYKDKKRCLEEQYFEYEVEKIGMKVKGNQTSVENLADLIGIEITQQVIDKYSQGIHEIYEGFELPAMNYTSNQLIYISLAQLWCSVRSKEKEQQHYNEDVHAPHGIRVTGMLRNMPEFSKEFSCSSNTTMNPDNRCSIRDLM